MAPWQVEFIAVTMLFNLVRFVAPIIFFFTKKGFISLPTLDAAPNGWGWPVFIYLTCGETCWLLVYYILEEPTTKVWGMNIGKRIFKNKVKVGKK